MSTDSSYKGKKSKKRKKTKPKLLPISRQEFESVLKKVSQRKSSSESGQGRV
jgi:hypothetical protein